MSIVVDQGVSFPRKREPHSDLHIGVDPRFRGDDTHTRLSWRNCIAAY
jgi:hypothetical protein